MTNHSGSLQARGESFSGGSGFHGGSSSGFHGGSSGGGGAPRTAAVGVQAPAAEDRTAEEELERQQFRCFEQFQRRKQQRRRIASLKQLPCGRSVQDRLDSDRGDFALSEAAKHFLGEKEKKVSLQRSPCFQRDREALPSKN